MMSIECPKPAYEKIVNNKALFDRIIKKRDKWHDIFLSAYIDGETAWKIFDKAEKYFKDFIDVRDMKDVFLDILELSNKVEDDYYSDKEETLIKYPTLIAYSILGKDILKPEKYGFSSRRQLEESVASFCIGEKWKLDTTFYRGHYVWRNNIYKNEFTNGMHGDFYLGQTDVSGDYQIHNTLFGDKEEFDTWKDTTYCRKAISEYQNWKNILLVTLRYAEAIGKGRIPEIVNWREIEKELDGFVPATAEAMFGSGIHDFDLEFIAECPIVVEGKELKTLPLHFSCGIGSDTVPYFPFVKDNKLLIMSEDKNGDHTLFDKGRFAEKKYSPYMFYEESDLVDLLKGIYKLYSRDRTEMPRLIEFYLKNPHK